MYMCVALGPTFRGLVMRKHSSSHQRCEQGQGDGADAVEHQADQQQQPVVGVLLRVELRYQGYDDPAACGAALGLGPATPFRHT